MIVYDVPAKIPEQRFMEAAFQQNFAETVQKKDFANGFRIKFKVGLKGKVTSHYVIEVVPKMRKTVIRQGSLYVGFTSLSIKNYLVVVRCNRCQDLDLGHMAKQCRLEGELYGHCGSSGHKKAECLDKGKSAKCIHCYNRGN